MDGKALRSRGQVLGGVIYGVLLALIGIGAFANGDVGVGVFALVVAALIVLTLALWTGIWLSTDGVRVRNPFSAFVLRWDEIVAFRIGRWKMLSACLIIDTNDGRSCHVFAVEVPNIDRRKTTTWERELAQHLNDRLQQERASISGG